MNRRSVAALLLPFVSLASLAAACSENDAMVESGGPAIPHPSDPDLAILRVGAPGSLPSIVIGGDGWVYRPTGDSGDQRGTRRSSFRPLSESRSSRPAAAPAPPAPTPVERQRLTEDGVQAVLALADELGLLAVPDDYADPGVTDLSSTFVSLTVDGRTYEHIAYALGFEDETGNRRNLERFVDALDDIESLVGDVEIGPPEAYVPEVYDVTIGATSATGGIEVTWPPTVPVEEGCAVLPIDQFADGVAGVYIANLDGTETRVAVVPDLPGDDCSGD